MNQRTMSVIAQLKVPGVKVENREGGNSMTPLIKSRQPITLEPVDASKLEKGDIVLVKVRGNIYTHLVLALQGDQVQIGNNHGKVNGWTKLSNVYGIATEIDGKPIGGVRSKVLVHPPGTPKI